MPTLISAFEVPPGSDNAFLRAFREAATTVSPGVLHRALRDDVGLRFVHVARVGSAEELPPVALPFPAHRAAYRVLQEDGEAEGAGGTVLITPFEVPDGGDERFVAHWDRLRGLFSGRQGYLGSRLHHRIGQDGFGYVAIVRWSSPLMYARTLQQPEVERAAAAQPFRGRPALYLAIDDRAA
jgi:heme-degrading monooxygenase HmoA